ncbi:MAG TPA: phosphate ABC transporter substrate-binding protein PstS [Nocardioides sp.]|uniref:phosphate ABC transporter substrate-binding protein PstS n=1 Tax=Nocardioides sp. TaxID=35761 RepID=UPI002F410793
MALLTLGLTLSACGDKSTSDSAAGPGGGGTLNGGGSTAQAVAEQAWRANYQKQNGGTINYEEVGSGTGVENFISGAYAFAGSDAYLTPDQVSQAKQQCGGDPIEVPAYVSPLAVAFNLPGIKSLNLDGETIAKIFNGSITTWNDPAIASQNSGVKLPSTSISTVHRSDDSGTTFNFTDYLSQAGDGAWSDEASVTWPASVKGGQGLEGTSGVVGGLNDTVGSIGYADDSAVKSTELGVVSVKVGSDYNPPTAEGAAKVLALSPIESGRAPSDMAIKIDRTSTEPGTYPLLLVSYLMACPSYSNPGTADMVKGFLSYVVSGDGQQAAASAAASAPLDPKLSQDATGIVSKITSGS